MFVGGGMGLGSTGGVDASVAAFKQVRVCVCVCEIVGWCACACVCGGEGGGGRGTFLWEGA